MSEKSHKLLRGGRGFWGERVKYREHGNVTALQSFVSVDDGKGKK